MSRNSARPPACERAYRLFLWCYPAEFRHEYSHEMVLAFRYRWQSEQRRSRLLGPLWLWLELVAEIVLTAPKEHFDMLHQDIRYALRMLAQNKAFTAIAILTLALGIGANAAIFSILDTMVLRPLPFADADRLVQIWEGDRRRGITNWESNAPDFQDWRHLSRSLEQIAGYQHASFARTGAGSPEQVDGARVTANFFDTLGVRPWLGRTAFSPDEDRTGAPVLILRYGTWRSVFNADPNVIGKTVSLDGLPRTIVGVLPETFAFPHVGGAGYFVPMAFTEAELQSRRMHWLYTIGRLRPGSTMAQAQSEMDGIANRLKKEHPDTNADSGVILVSLATQTSGTLGAPLWVAFGAVGFVLLIACANIANLLLARSTVRQREIGVRMVLGANRIRILRQLLTESVVLFSIGAIAGIAVAAGGIRLLVNSLPAEMRDRFPHSADMHVNLLSLAFTFGITMAAAVIAGLAPAWTSSRQHLASAVNQGGARAAGGRSGRFFRGLLIVGEVGLAVMLAVAAGLLSKTFVLLQTMNHGFQPDHVTIMSVQLPAGRYAPGVPIIRFCDQLLERVNHLPGVATAGAIDFIPFLGANVSGEFAIEGAPPAARAPGARIRSVAANYFEAMRIPLVQGRLFGPADTIDGPKVVLVSQALARHHFPGQNPIGRRLHFTGERENWREIIGVVGDVKHSPTEETAAPYIYFPFSQRRSRQISIVVRAGGGTASVAGGMRAALTAVDPAMPVASEWTMREVMAISTMPQAISSILVTVFGALAAVLMVVGVFGVTSYAVTQRTREMGIRMALGASRAGVAALILRQSMVRVAAGLAIGIAGAFGISGLLRSMLFGISPMDPLVYVLVILLMFGIAAAATLIPARRATTVDPAVALKYE